MDMPSILGMSVLNKKQVPNKISKYPVIIGKISIPARAHMNKPSSFIQDVDMLVANNKKAFVYNSGNVDIVNERGIRTIKFKNKKSAALYLMKAGWQYV